MKKAATLLLSTLFVISIVVMSYAEDMEKGSTMDMDKGSTMDVNIAEEAEISEDVEDVGDETIEGRLMKKSDSSEWGVAYSAKTIIRGTSEDSEVSGTIDFVETGDGVQVVASLSGVTTTGKHGIHIHEKGSCENGGKAAGGHFNPSGVEHGLLPRDGHEKSHTGDMGNIGINDNTNGSLVVFMPGLSLTDGSRNIVGKAVILHADEDNFGQPTGNAGGRIGCGIIALNN